MNAKEIKSIEIKPYRPNEMAKFYQVSYPTFLKWITAFKERLGERNGLYFSVKQVEIIFDELGIPKTLLY